MDFDIVSAVIGLGVGSIGSTIFAMFRYGSIIDGYNRIIDAGDFEMSNLYEEVYALEDLLEGAAQELHEAATQKTPRKR